MKALLALSAAVLIGLGAWTLLRREPPSISEEQARSVAESALLEFCQSENFEENAPKNLFTEFVFQGQKPPADARFNWTFHWLNKTGDPWKQVAVSVGKTGEMSLEFITLPPNPEENAPAASSAVEVSTAAPPQTPDAQAAPTTQ